MRGSDRLKLVPWFLCATLIVALGVRWLTGSGFSGPSSRSSSAGAADRRSQGGMIPPRSRRGRSIYVQIAGMVRRPGVYRIAEGSRTFELVRLAGGVRPGGDTDSMQLAAKLVDGASVGVRRRGRIPAGAGPAAADAAGPVSLGVATAEQLERLDGIGPALARRIIEWRERNGGFRSVADLDRVPGIGPAKFAALKDEVVP